MGVLPDLLKTSFTKTDLGKEKTNVEMRGFEPRTFRMQSGRSTTELHPQLDINVQ